MKLVQLFSGFDGRVASNGPISFRSIVTLGILLLWPGQNVDSLNGQDFTCIPQARGVPALPGPPIWWNADGDSDLPDIPNPPESMTDCVWSECLPAELVRYTDPRWRGAVGHSDPSGHVEFRALYEEGAPDRIFLSWTVKVDAGGLNSDGPLAGDALWFAVTEETGDATIFKISLNLNAPSELQASDALDIQVTRKEGAGDWHDPGVPEWLADKARLWTDWGGEPESAWWAVQVMVPNTDTGFANGLRLGDSFFDMWYTFFVAEGGMNPAQYHWPFGRDDILSTDPTTVPAPSTPSSPTPASGWDRFVLGASDDPTCGGDVELHSTQIGTEGSGTDPTSVIRIGVSNTFVARPKNIRDPIMGDELGAHTIEAKFYLANWGTQANWNDVDDINTLWKQVVPETESSPPDNDGPIAPGETAHGAPDRNDIHYTRSFDESFFEGEARSTHQCMLVELSGKSTATPLKFRNKSVYRNMDFVEASTFRRDAQISVKGLGPAPGSDPVRDVYLFVETVNMPEEVDDGMELRTETVIRPQSYLVIVRHLDSTVVANGDTARFFREDSLLVIDSDTISITRDEPTVGGDTLTVPPLSRITVRAGRAGQRGEALGQASAAGLLGSDEIDSLMPTYRVHAWHTTGDTIEVDGTKLAVLEAQSSFGYWLDHEGEIRGWEHSITGAVLDTISENFFRLSVPADSFLTVTTAIEAVAPFPLWLLLVIVFLVIFLIVVLWRLIAS